jgi:hypothetical protein
LTIDFFHLIFFLGGPHASSMDCVGFVVENININDNWVFVFADTQNPRIGTMFFASNSFNVNIFVFVANSLKFERQVLIIGYLCLQILKIQE